MKAHIKFIVIIFLFSCRVSINNIFAQNKDTLFVASWNLENLFDTVHDEGKNDVEFTPEGSKEWSADRLDHKLSNLARVIKSMNNNNGPDILGVVEVEHQSLLDSMIVKYLNDKPYKIAYAESPDARGIDNGLIYNSRKLKLISVQPDSVRLPDDYPTRLILNVKLLTSNNDTISVFINHWPSRIGGEEKSEENRIAAAKLLRKNVEDFLSNKSSDVIIIGDFNDNPDNSSIVSVLLTKPYECGNQYDKNRFGGKNVLLNLAYPIFEKGEGTYKYRDSWNMLDQMIISQDLIIGKKVEYVCNSFEIYKPDFMVTHSGKYLGTPFPTYGGNRYLGGYSDHFPVIAKFIIMNE